MTAKRGAEPVKAAALPKLSELVKPEHIDRCSCGSAGFFDWGVRLSDHDLFTSDKTDGIAHAEGVLICISCHLPIVIQKGRLYDASEYITAAQVDAMIEGSRVPIPVMDDRA